MKHHDILETGMGGELCLHELEPANAAGESEKCRDSQEVLRSGLELGLIRTSSGVCAQIPAHLLCAPESQVLPGSRE